jgi:uncharacterized protein
MKKVILIHGWEGSPNEGWKPWLKKELEQKGITVLNPNMPDPNYPKQKEWIKHLSSIIGTPDSETFLVGHSLGAITILRYLEVLEENQKIGGAIFIAGFTDDLKIPELSDFFKEKINWDKIKKHCNKFFAIHSDNDHYVPLTYGNIFKKNLGAEIIILHKMRHFSGSDGITEIPILLNILLKRF